MSARAEHWIWTSRTVDRETFGTTGISKTRPIVAATSVDACTVSEAARTDGAARSRANELVARCRIEVDAGLEPQ